MAQLTINAGTVANDGTGDPLRTAFGKVNANFTELYARPLFSGSYADLSNKPTIPAAPNLAPYVLTASLSPVALSGAYADLTGKPAAYALPPATTAALGGVKASASIAAAGDGTLSLAQNGATVGQVLQWNGTTWTPATVTSGGGGVATFNTRSGAVTLTAADVIAALTTWAATAPTSPPGNGAPWLNSGLLSFANS